MGLDNAVIMGDPAIIVTGLLLMPVALFFAFILPGITFIPIGDLPNTVALSTMIVVAVSGNVVRAFIIGIPVIITQLYVASAMTQTFTNLAHQANFTFAGYSGDITSFLDGGLILRLWLFKAFSGNWIALATIPVMFGVLFATWYFSKKALEKPLE